MAVAAFDYSAVKNQVTGLFNNDVNIGQGIRAMLTVKMGQSKSVTLVEREKLSNIDTEIARGATAGNDQGKKAKKGRIVGADAMLFGDIVIFGRDDKSKGGKGGGCSALGPFYSRLCAGGGAFSKEEKAVVAINLRIVDTETSEVIATAEARGESLRKSKDFSGFLGSAWKGGGGGQVDMTSSNFADTIIGEATQDAVNKIAAFVDEKVATIASRSRSVEGRVANIDGCTLYLSVGANDGVQVGDRFEIHQILKEVLSPETKEVLDLQTVKVGDFVVGTVRDKVAIGQYGGQAITPTYPKGYAARLVSQ
jgi:curli biogenesis system outer membrane secretion channel CsgG